MSKFTIYEWSGRKREVEFVGYNREHTACFIRDEKNERRAIALHLPHWFDLRFRKNPIAPTSSPALEINRVALHVPACFVSQQEKETFDNPNSDEAQRAKVFGDDVWKVLTSHKCWLEPKDDTELAKLLQAELDDQRRRYAIREKETADNIAAIKQEIAALPPGEAEKVEELQKRIKQLQDMLRGEFTTCVVAEPGPFISIFDVTLDMARKGWGNLYERTLERQWAEHFKVDLQFIPAAAEAFRAWIKKHAYNARQTTHDMTTRTVEIGVGLKLDPWQLVVLEACVMYEICFEQDHRCWMDRIEERAVTDPQEIEDFDRLEGKLEASFSAIRQDTKAIKTVTAQTKADVSELLQKKKQRERKSHIPGAKAKAKWYGKERELAQAARHARKFLNPDWKKNGIKRGKLPNAIGRMKTWWVEKYQGTQLEGFLRDQKPGWLRRVIIKNDWHRERNH